MGKLINLDARVDDRKLEAAVEKFIPLVRARYDTLRDVTPEPLRHLLDSLEESHVEAFELVKRASRALGEAGEVLDRLGKAKITLLGKEEGRYGD